MQNELYRHIHKCMYALNFGFKNSASFSNWLSYIDTLVWKIVSIKTNLYIYIYIYTYIHIYIYIYIYILFLKRNTKYLLKFVEECKKIKLTPRQSYPNSAPPQIPSICHRKLASAHSGVSLDTCFCPQDKFLNKRFTRWKSSTL